MSDVVCDERPCPECPDCATLRTRLAEVEAENGRLRGDLTDAFHHLQIIKLHGASTGKAELTQYAEHGMNAARAALAQTTEKDHDDS